MSDRRRETHVARIALRELIMTNAPDATVALAAKQYLAALATGDRQGDEELPSEVYMQWVRDGDAVVPDSSTWWFEPIDVPSTRYVLAPREAGDDD